MTTKSFSTVYVNNLTLNHTHALINSTVEAATSIVPSPYGELVNASSASMQTACNALGEQLNKVTKSPLTQSIIDKDLERDECWREIKSNVTTHEKGRDAAKRAAATALHIFMEPYWDMLRSALNTETDQINDLLAKFNSNSDLGAHALLIGIDAMLAELGKINTAFDVLYQQRTVQEGTKTAPSASRLKAAAVKSYTQFCTVVEQAANLTPSDALTALFNTMEELRKKYAPLVSKPAEKQSISAN